MKIYLIRHAKVDLKWPVMCNSAEFDNACREYDTAGISDVSPMKPMDDCKRIYVSSMYRSIETAKGLFPNGKLFEAEVGEVPLKSFMDCSARLPLCIWNIVGRLQWYCGSLRQLEKRLDTIERCKKVICELECRNENCIIVTHGFFMRTFLKCLKQQGYTVSGNRIDISNLQVVLAENGKC